VTLELSEAAHAYLEDKGFDRLFGARPMARLIERELKRPLADEILFGRLRDGGSVRVELRDDRIALEVVAGDDASQHPSSAS
jgi:ATP-dependent Clp protease ATP-binding subunit ClpA